MKQPQFKVLPFECGETKPISGRGKIPKSRSPSGNRSYPTITSFRDWAKLGQCSAAGLKKEIQSFSKWTLYHQQCLLTESVPNPYCCGWWWYCCSITWSFRHKLLSNDLWIMQEEVDHQKKEQKRGATTQSCGKWLSRLKETEKKFLTWPSLSLSAMARIPSQMHIMISWVSLFFAEPGVQPRSLQIFCEFQLKCIIYRHRVAFATGTSVPWGTHQPARQLQLIVLKLSLHRLLRTSIACSKSLTSISPLWLMSAKACSIHKDG